MDISIIIVNWNTKDLLTDCINSIFAQKLIFSYELIVVDNGSEDGSQLLIRQSYPTVKLIENKTNLGFGKANNIGIAVAKGRYLCLVNSDVRLIDGCLQELTEYMDIHPLVGMSGPKIYYPDMRVQDSCRKFPSLWRTFCSEFKLDTIFLKSSFFSGEHMFYFSHEVEIKPDYLVGCLLMLRKETLDKVGAFDERFFIYAEEVDLAVRIRDAGWEVVFLPQAKAIHNHAGSSSKDPLRFLLAYQKSILQYWRKHHSKFAVFVHSGIFIIKYFLQIAIWVLSYPFFFKRWKELNAKIFRNYKLISVVVNGA